MVAVSNAKSLTQPAFTGTVTVFNSQASTTTIAATNLILPTDWNSALNIFLTLSGNTAGQSTVSGTNIVFAGGNNVTLSASTAAGAATVSIGGFAVGSQYIPNESFGNNTVWMGTSSNASVFSQNSLYLQPMVPFFPVSISVMNVPVSFGGTSTASAVSRNWSQTWSFCLYSVGTGANSTVLTSLTSVSGSWACLRTSGSATYTIAINGNSTTATTTNFLAGAYILQVPMVTNFMRGGVYYLGFANSTASANQQSAMSAGWLAVTNINSNFGLMQSGAASVGITQSNSSIFMADDAVIFSASSGAWPSTIGSNALSRAVSGAQIYVEFINQTPI